ncbi:MAG: HlyD family efflux transporter periplasmic adaptor subunit [Lewinellaceae bacterium]|nr:HlyD family efflux transporter periplasmic adaptor subunit [Saprospiraceae bacterium]MCB9339359.1 HlyD family efflux transporter periplasmic adaptor subunit [Lewinellaceae bacterium]
MFNNHYLKYPLFFASLALLAACGNNQADAPAEDPPPPKTLVDTTAVTIRDIRQEERFPATTFYPESNRMASPIAGYLLRSPQEAGETVATGQLLFTIETKEHRAINADPDLKKSDLAKMGVVSVHTPSGGIILTLDQRQGDFVSEGSTLCTIARSDKIGFRLSVPYEFNNYVKIGTNCTIELPDKTRIPGRITENLNTAAITSQTQTFLVKPLKPVALPEGLNVFVVVQTEGSAKAVALPKSAILTNETMDEFWVMKLVNDSTAVKIPVTLGLTTGESVEVKTPDFTKEDRILTEGNYGLEDTALVKVKVRSQTE